MFINNPTGTIRPYAGATAPAGYLLCDGASLLRTDYPELFSCIGTTFGAVDGTHFSVPDCQGKTIFGYDSADTNFDAIGKTGGAKTKDLSHSHTANSHTHTGSATTSVDSNQTATMGSTDKTGYAQRNHTHALSMTTNTQSNTGSNSQLTTPIEVLNPYITLNWIIKL